MNSRTGRKKKIDRKKLHAMLKAGQSKTQCAKFFGVTPSAITQAAQNLNVGITQTLAMQRGSQIVDESIDSLGQIRKANEAANYLLDLLIAWSQGDPQAQRILEKHHRLGRIGTKKGINSLSFKDPKELIIAVCKEIRGQVKLSLDIYESLYNHRAVEAFQAEVIAAIGEEAPDVRDKIIRRLKEKHALRSATRITP